MKKLIAPVLMAYALFVVPALAAGPLDSLVGEKRVLLLFSKSRSNAQLDKQVDLLRESRPELNDRELVVLRTSGREETRSVIGYTPINRGAARKLRAQLKPETDEFTVILVGKDGLEKKRWLHLVQPEELFDVIDAAQEPVAQAVETTETN